MGGNIGPVLSLKSHGPLIATHVKQIGPYNLYYEKLVINCFRCCVYVLLL